jgi:DNA gyrase/topoisomerase IV subunit A
MKNQSDFKDLLKEIEKLKSVLRDKDEQMQIIEKEMRARPSLSSVNATEILIKKMESELKEL